MHECGIHLSKKARHNLVMPKYSKLSEAELELELQGLPGWTISDRKLHRDYRFPDFSHAFGFMATAATYIQARDHHPEWSNVYNKVSVDLTSHDAGGITSADVDLAVLLESLASKLQ